MTVELPLDRMSIEEKLRAMETLWDDLCRDDSQVESPAWHATILQKRAERIAAGSEVFIDWETAKRQLSDRLG